MTMLQITAHSGPAECCLAVKKALAAIEKEARSYQIEVDVIEQVVGPIPGTLSSVLIDIVSKNPQLSATAFADRWVGSLLWVCESPFRTGHRRKNWFIGGSVHQEYESPPDGEIKYEAVRSSGPGGQHVNKTSTAVRATHLSTGLSVKIQTERSQLANKKLATQVLLGRVAAIDEAKAATAKSDRRIKHHQAERGNPQRTFIGPSFIER